MLHFIGLKDSASGLPVWVELSLESGVLESSLEGFSCSEMSVVEQEPCSTFAVLSGKIIHVCPQNEGDEYLKTEVSVAYYFGIRFHTPIDGANEKFEGWCIKNKSFFLQVCICAASNASPGVMLPAGSEDGTRPTGGTGDPCCPPPSLALNHRRARGALPEEAPFRAFRKRGQTCLLTCDLPLPPSL